MHPNRGLKPTASIIASLRDERLMKCTQTVVETHGYHHSVATRRTVDEMTANRGLKPTATIIASLRDERLMKCTQTVG